MAGLSGDRHRSVIVYLGGSLLVYTGMALWVLLVLAPRTPYADQWGFYSHFLTQSFPLNVLGAVNGHRELFPNLLRVFELYTLTGNHCLQIACGAVLAVLAFIGLWRMIKRDFELSEHTRAAALFLCGFAIFWLGNVRTLGHANESVHAYLVISCLVGALLMTLPMHSDQLPRLRQVLMASLLAIIASFSFGAGIAVFPAVLTALFLRRCKISHIALVIGAFAGTLCLYLFLPDGNDMRGVITLASFDTLRFALQWLATPFVYLFGVVLDPAIAKLAPSASLRMLAEASAIAWTSWFGDINTSVFPQAALSAFAVAMVSWQALRSPFETFSLTRQFGVSLSVFGIATAILVSLSRHDYFIAHPDQVHAPRYMLWPCIFWLGVGLSMLGQSALSLVHRWMMGVTLALPLLALPSEIGMLRLGYNIHDIALATATASAVGVLDPQQPLGETQADDMRIALPLMRKTHTFMFAWPQTQLFGTVLPGNAQRLIVNDMEMTSVENLLEGEGTIVRFRSLASANYLLIAGDDPERVIGLAVREADGHWKGWIRGRPLANTLVVAELER